MSKRLIPLLDRVLVEKIIAPTKSVGGILLPESAVSKVRTLRLNPAPPLSPRTHNRSLPPLIPQAVNTHFTIATPGSEHPGLKIVQICCAISALNGAPSVSLLARMKCRNEVWQMLFPPPPPTEKSRKYVWMNGEREGVG